MQSLDYKLKTSNTSYVTARHDVQYEEGFLFFLSSLNVSRQLVKAGRRQAPA